MASRIRSNAIFSFSLDVANDSLMKPSPHLPKASSGTTATLDLPSSFMASSWVIGGIVATLGAVWILFGPVISLKETPASA
jgi:hypothetical protein